jgi:hypothetical protein
MYPASRFCVTMSAEFQVEAIEASSFQIDPNNSVVKMTWIVVH